MTTDVDALEPLERAVTIDDVVHRLDLIIKWSIDAKSAIGYFAVLYRRGTVAIQEAIARGEFNDPEWIEQLDVDFANRYFHALNGYFHPAEYSAGLTLPWEVAFVKQHNTKVSLIQQMIASLNAHICYDLGLVTASLSGTRLKAVEADFVRVNRLVAAQTERMLDVVERRSPRVRWLRRAIPREVTFIAKLLTEFRKSAWLFAYGLAQYPALARETEANKAAWTAGLGAYYLDPWPRWTPTTLLVKAIGVRENRDVGGNIRALADIKDDPDPVSSAFA
ncbi:DUF5995 family protein [Mycobacterium sp. LTG2003]